MCRSLSHLAGGVLILALVTIVHGEFRACVNQSVVKTGDPVPYFQAQFPDVTFKVPNHSQRPGGRNATWCCILAINEWVENDCSNTSTVQIDPRILDSAAQFPCGASYNGDDQGAPPVQVTYGWHKQYCPGWQISQASIVNEWAQSLVAFILPAVVFSFNIPRPRKLKIWEELFPSQIVSYRMAAGVFGAIVAAVLVTVDTIVWLFISFAFAGPLLLSGLYEAQLDKRVLTYLQERIKFKRLPLGFRARVLFTILCGNLSLYPAWSDTMDLARHLDELDKQSKVFRRVNRPPWLNVCPPEPRLFGPSTPASSVTNHLRDSERSLEADKISFTGPRDSHEDHSDTEPLRPYETDELRPYPGVIARDHTSSNPEIISLRQIKTASSMADSELGSSHELHGVATTDRKYARTKSIKKVTVMLRAMLSCQYSFGSTIGGPVVFFLGSFIFALLEIKQDTGDENIAEALAFGMWWIIIPHVAAVAGLLLAGNNPNILAGIVSIRDMRYEIGESLVNQRLKRRGTIDPEVERRLHASGQRKKVYSNLLERVYEAEYTPAWMWDRGKYKQDWLVVLFTDSWLKYERDGKIPGPVREDLVSFLTEAVMLSLADWLFLWSFAFMLLFIPCLFGFLTAYYTPVIGIACRAITILTYVGAQTLLLILWAYYLTKRDKYWHMAWKLKNALQKRPNHDTDFQLGRLVIQLKDQAFKDTTASNDQRRYPGERINSIADDVTRMDRAHPAKKWTFYIFTTFGLLLALMTSIGGSTMQIIGLYRNGICLMKASDWFRSDRDSVLVLISTNSSESIREAQKDWLIIGSCSTVFLATVCYIGWWYQKGLRKEFRTIAGQIDRLEDDYDDAYTQ